MPLCILLPLIVCLVHTTCLRMDSVLHALVYHVFNIYMSCCNLLCLFSLVLMLLLNVDILCLLAGFDLAHLLTHSLTTPIKSCQRSRWCLSSFWLRVWIQHMASEIIKTSLSSTVPVHCSSRRFKTKTIKNYCTQCENKMFCADLSTDLLFELYLHLVLTVTVWPISRVFINNVCNYFLFS